MESVNQDECFYPLWLIFFSVRILHQEPLGTLLNCRCGRIADHLSVRDDGPISSFLGNGFPGFVVIGLAVSSDDDGLFFAWGDSDRIVGDVTVCYVHIEGDSLVDHDGEGGLVAIGVLNGDGVVTIDGLTEEGTVEVYKGGQKIAYSLGDEIKDYGHYEVVVTDALGNSRTYAFTLQFQMNAWAINHPHRRWPSRRHRCHCNHRSETQTRLQEAWLRPYWRGKVPRLAKQDKEVAQSAPLPLRTRVRQWETHMTRTQTEMDLIEEDYCLMAETVLAMVYFCHLSRTLIIRSLKLFEIGKTLQLNS